MDSLHTDRASVGPTRLPQRKRQESLPSIVVSPERTADSKSRRPILFAAAAAGAAALLALFLVRSTATDTTPKPEPQRVEAKTEMPAAQSTPAVPTQTAPDSKQPAATELSTLPTAPEDETESAEPSAKPKAKKATPSHRQAPKPAPKPAPTQRAPKPNPSSFGSYRDFGF